MSLRGASYFARYLTFANKRRPAMSFSSSVIDEQKKRKFVLNMSTSCDSSTPFKPLVIIIGGPTGVGKSSVSARLCSIELATEIVNKHRKNNGVDTNISNNVRGHIISADSVQAYQGVQIGANKPTSKEREETPHHLIDIVDSDSVCQYNAAEWMHDAMYVLYNLTNIDNDVSDDDELLDHESKVRKSRIDSFLLQSKGDNDQVLPVVVGGTMMYLQWLVHGKPDAMKPSQEAIEKAENTVRKFQNQGDECGWDAAVQHVSSLGTIFSDRILKLPGRDWYRLRRTLEVAYTLSNDSEKEKKSKELFNGQREGGLHESSTYDVRCFFLCPDDRMAHTEIVDSRCEDMLSAGLLKETAELYVSGQLPDQGQQARAIGYRQTLAYLKRKNFSPRDNVEFEAYLDEFKTATRRYAKKQMQWFRKDDTFVFIPVPLTEPSESRVDTVANYIKHYCTMSRTDFEQELIPMPKGNKKIKGESGISLDDMSLSIRIKYVNEQQGKNMKFYQGKRHKLFQGSHEYEEVLKEADACTVKIH